MPSRDDLDALLLSLKLAAVTTPLLLALATPLAWWLARTRSLLRGPVAAASALPMVLPPTVLGFYLLVSMGPHGWLGKLTQSLGLGLLPFTFGGLVVASVLYSLPFALQPLQHAFAAVEKRQLEAAATLGAAPLDAFLRVALPQARAGYAVAALLVFAHTLGEFGVVLMIGGNIPHETRVASVRLYHHVEALEYADAHRMALILLGVSFALLLVLYTLFHRVMGREAA